MEDINDLKSFYEDSLKFIEENLLDKKGSIHIIYQKKFEEEINKILEKHWANNISELYYCAINNILIKPLCKECSKDVNFVKMNIGYRTFCSTKCKCDNKDVKEKIQKTCINKYGVDNPSKAKVIIEKRKQTNLERYGETTNLKTKATKNKIKQTNLEKYGVEFHQRKHINNIENFNSDFINKNFSENGFLNKKKIKKYFNIGDSYLQEGQIKLKNNHLIDFKKLLPFNNQNQQTQNEIYNTIYKENLTNKNFELLNNIKLNDRLFLKHNTNINKTLELDILDLNKNVAIEYNGLMFHSFGLSKHNMFNNADKETEDKNLHLIKTQLCEEKGIQLFHIFENEWLNERQRNIWISMINGKLNKHTKIYARKTIVKEIKLKDKKGNLTDKNDTKLIKDFLDKNHMQGYLPSIVNIGLFVINNEINPDTGLIEEKEELVSIMSFSKPRMSKNYQWELIRYATKLNTTIVGGGSKLLSFFEKIYNPESLISYANRRWSNGQFYKKTGFTFSHYSDPNYYYFKPELLSKIYKNEKIKQNLLYSRNQFQKHKLEGYFLEGKLSFFDENLTETQNMFLNGQRKIYDSGNMIFTKFYN